MDVQTLAKERLAKRIAGEVVLSDEAGQTIQKWRNIFKIPQRRLAEHMGIMPSVISDYENGRRKSPGIKVIKRIVDAMIDLDEGEGGKIISEFSTFPTKTILSDAILDMKEFLTPINVKTFCKTINATKICKDGSSNNKIHGYTVVDGLKAIVELSPMEMVKLYGYTSERALIFVNAHRGRSAMVALKVTNLRPGLVVFHGTDTIDELAKRIGEIESVPICTSKIKDVKKLINILKSSFK